MVPGGQQRPPDHSAPCGPAADPARGNPWEILDRLGHDLQRCKTPAEALRLLTTAVRDSLGADVVYSWSATGPEPAELAGRRQPAPRWCQDFARRLVAEVPATDSHLLRTQLAAPPAAADDWPCSAALVRVGHGRPVWVVAVSFTADHCFQPTDLHVMLLARRMVTSFHQHQRLYDKLKDTVLGLIHSFTTAIDAKDPYTGGHSERVARIALRLGQQMSLPEEFLSDIYLAGLLHDVGKIGTRDDVLRKTGPLTADELAHIQQHAVIGDAILATIKQLAHLRPGVRNHHERWDGQGYPDGLAGENIPLLARILAVADSCDALLSDRPYRPARSPREIDAILAAGAGQQWDPQVVAHFQACRGELYPICRKGVGESACVAVSHVVAAGRDEQSPGAEP